MPRCFSCLDGSCDRNRIAEQQELLGHGGFTSVRVRNYGECASNRTFPFNLIHVGSQSVFLAREVYRSV